MKTLQNKDFYLASDCPVGKDTVKKNVESLAAVEDGVDPLNRERGTRESKEPGESKEKREEESVSQGCQHSAS